MEHIFNVNFGMRSSSSSPTNSSLSSISSYQTCQEHHKDDKKSNCPLLSLPLEIRCQIYRELLISDAEWIRPVPPWVASMMRRFPNHYMVKPWPCPINSSNSTGDEHTFTSTAMDTAILRVSKQVFAEARPILLAENPVFLTYSGRSADSDADHQVLDMLRYVRVLALKVDYFRHPEPWVQILRQRGNLRTVRLRFMDRSTGIAHGWLGDRDAFGRIVEDWRGIKACAVASVECYLEAYFNGSHLARDAEEEMRVGELEGWLEREVASKMRKGCTCSKREDGTHFDRVEIGRRSSGTSRTG
jgi:hypothetical protein